MLEGMYDVLEAKYQDSTQAWDYLVELIACDNCAPLLFQLKDKLDWLNDEKFSSRLFKQYDPQLLQSDYYDHLGDMYLDRVVTSDSGRSKSQYLTSAQMAQMAAALDTEVAAKQLHILDPAAGSGRLLMEVHKRAPNAMLYGVDSDLRMLRIAFTNFSIHNIKGIFLHADTLKHEIDMKKADGIHNWTYANNWYSQMHKLRDRTNTTDLPLFNQEEQKRP